MICTFRDFPRLVANFRHEEQRGGELLADSASRKGRQDFIADPPMHEGLATSAVLMGWQSTGPGDYQDHPSELAPKLRR
jgi:hypothetical protein